MFPQTNMGAHVHVPDVFMGARQYPLQVAQNKPAGPGVWETQQSADADKKPEFRQQPMDLKTATSRFFGIANALQNAQTYGNNVRDQRDAQRQIASNEALPKADRISYKAS